MADFGYMDFNKDFDLENQSCETDDSDEESNGPDWYVKDDELDEDDKELLDNTTEKTFGFETDHAALKGNLDYQNLIKTLALLEAQRIKTVEDLDKLEKLRFTVRDNPRQYLEKFLSGDTSDIPARIEVVPVPEIDWSKYSCKTRVKHSATKTKVSPEPPRKPKVEVDPVKEELEDGLDKMTVRGRVYDQSKPQTFNQLWTAEEQLRLEELLLEFPPERNENSRWRKIAKALGNRTTQQVCSRVQKYFKKLTKEGLPIPGHNPKSNYMTTCKKRRNKKKMGRNSTFFPTQHLGVPQLLDQWEEESKPEMSTLTWEMEREIIKKVLEFKKKDAQLTEFTHPGIKCTGCGEMPLRGTRWRCLICQGANLCSDCVINQLSAEPYIHPPFHPLEPLSNPSVAVWDPDYSADSFQSTNYLDPNFLTNNVAL